MNPQNLPPCLCGRRQWKNIGFDTSHYRSIYDYSCTNCRIFACLFVAHYCKGLFISEESATRLWTSHSRYIDEIVFPIWKERSHLLEAHREVIMRVHRVMTCQRFGLPPHTPFEQIPGDVEDTWKTAYHELLDLHEYTCPAHFSSLPDLPDIPRQLHIFLSSPSTENQVWVELDQESSEGISRPTAHYNPIMILEEVSEALGIRLSTQITPNLFAEDNEEEERLRRWRTFSLQGNTLAVGQYKQGLVITVRADDPTEHVVTLGELPHAAKTDRTVYWVDDALHTQPLGRRNALTLSEVKMGRSLTILAWSHEAAVNYLSLLLSRRIEILNAVEDARKFTL